MPKITNVLVSTYSVLVADDDARQLLQAAVPHAAFTYCANRELTPEMVADATVWMGNPSHQLLSQAKNLKFLQLYTAGADYYFSSPEIVPQGLTVATATGAFGLSIAEYMVGGLLMLMRHLHEYRDNQNRRLWQPLGDARSITGSTVLVVGLGDLGSEFAWRMKALGAHVIGLRRSNMAKPDCVDELYLTHQLDELLPQADVVALCLPSTAQTRGMFDEKRLNLFKRESYLINVGRGDAVDADALCQALRSGKLAGALIDVTSPEPLPAEHPLWLETNAVITPHCSGNYDLPYTIRRVFEIAAENLRRYDADEPIINAVDPGTGYRRLL